MNNEQLKQALMTECPVVYFELDGTPVKYEKVKSVIYSKQVSQTAGRTPRGQIRVSAELLDTTLRSVRVVEADRLCFEGESL